MWLKLKSHSIRNPIQWQIHRCSTYRANILLVCVFPQWLTPFHHHYLHSPVSSPLNVMQLNNSRKICWVCFCFVFWYSKILQFCVRISNVWLKNIYNGNMQMERKWKPRETKKYIYHICSNVYFVYIFDNTEHKKREMWEEMHHHRNYVAGLFCVFDGVLLRCVSIFAVYNNSDCFCCMYVFVCDWCWMDGVLAAGS